LLTDEHGLPKNWIVGGEYVSLRIVAQANVDIDSLIIGFFVKDRLGQMLFGDNTIIETTGRDTSCKAGDTILSNFDFLLFLQIL
jgi:lipopolysaccharide transport system ATP-binding protein